MATSLLIQYSLEYTIKINNNKNTTLLSPISQNQNKCISTQMTTIYLNLNSSFLTPNFTLKNNSYNSEINVFSSMDSYATNQMISNWLSILIDKLSKPLIQPSNTNLPFNHLMIPVRNKKSNIGIIWSSSIILPRKHFAVPKMNQVLDYAIVSKFIGDDIEEL